MVSPSSFSMNLFGLVQMPFLNSWFVRLVFFETENPQPLHQYDAYGPTEIFRFSVIM
jgi:hypothetical protein